MNVIEEDFDENAVEVYKQNIDILKDENRINNTEGYGYLYELLINNIKSYNEYVKNLNMDKIYEYIDEPEIRTHIVRIVKGESKMLESAYSYVRRKASKYIDLNSISKDEEKEEEKKDNSDL